MTEEACKETTRLFGNKAFLGDGFQVQGHGGFPGELGVEMEVRQELF